MRGVRMHCEQSSVGKVSESCAMWPPMDGISFDQNDLVAAVGDIERGLDAGDAAADDQSPSCVIGTLIGIRGRLRFTFSTMTRTRSMALAGRLGFSSCTHEQCSRMLAISQRNGLNAGFGGGAAEGRFVHARRTGGDNHAGQLLLFDGVPDHVLARIGAHVLVIDGVHDAGDFARGLRDAGASRPWPHVLAAVTDENADPCHVASSVCSVAGSAFLATGASSGKSFAGNDMTMCSPSSFRPVPEPCRRPG